MTWFCVEKLGRLPGELDEITMRDLMRAMIAWSLMEKRLGPKQ